MKIFVSQGYSYDPKGAYDLARVYARSVAQEGHIPVSPVLLFHEVYDNSRDYQRIIMNCFTLINDCDALWVFDAFGESQGVCAEMAYAEIMGKPVRIINNVRSVDKTEDYHCPMSDSCWEGK